jgi:hypothetical protein
MRRPSTKFPNPVIRTAVRHRGYGTRVIYNPVERPPFHGKFYLWAAVDLINQVTMTKDDLYYWSVAEHADGTWANLVASPSPGKFWNLWFRVEKGEDVASSWAEAETFVSGTYAIAAGPIPPGIVIDSFEV